MTPYTQNLDPPNCFQTSVASVLDVKPSTLPRQMGRLHNYEPDLNRYLETLGLRFIRVEPYSVTLEAPGYHLISGHPFRPLRMGDTHMVVGQHGKIVWDPHPSRSGLALVKSWGVIVRIVGQDRW